MPGDGIAGSPGPRSCVPGNTYDLSELTSWVTIEVAVLGSTSLAVLMVSVDVTQN